MLADRMTRMRVTRLIRESIRYLAGRARLTRLRRASHDSTSEAYGRPVFAKDADLTVYWPAVRSEWEEDREEKGDIEVQARVGVEEYRDRVRLGRDV